MQRPQKSSEDITETKRHHGAKVPALQRRRASRRWPRVAGFAILTVVFLTTAWMVLKPKGASKAKLDYPPVAAAETFTPGFAPTIENKTPAVEEAPAGMVWIPGGEFSMGAQETPIIGFSFSMAVSRYDQRKNYEEEEANAIGTEYLRVGLLPASDATTVRALLAQYVEKRLAFYVSRDRHTLQEVDRDTARLQSEMWDAVQRAATAQPTPTVSLVAAGMNDVLNRQGYTQAAWWNRIPVAAWILMIALAICCGLLVGYSARRKGTVLSIVLPLVISVAFFLIADIESPRHGSIRVAPRNLISLSESLHR